MAGYTGYIVGTHKLFQFYSKWVRELIRRLPGPIHDPVALNAFLHENAKKKRVTLAYDAAICTQYNEEFEALKSEVRGLTPAPRDFRTTLWGLFAIRLAAIAAVVMGLPLWATIVISAAQFLVSPYSLFVSAAHFLHLLPAMLAGHHIAIGAMQSALSMLLPSFILQWVRVEITTAFCAAVIICDQAACVYALFYTPAGPTKNLGARRTLNSVWFGFINTKTYMLLSLLAVRGSRVCLVSFALDAYFGFSQRIAGAIFRWLGTSWSLLFYMQHRMAHIPRVYEAHKQHHHLHDTTPFDADLYAGSGQAEEFFSLAMEMVCGAVLGTPPVGLNVHCLRLSLGNKFDHGRKVEGRGGVNFHADHHTVHTKNFAMQPSFDMVMDTLHYVRKDSKFENGKHLIHRVTGQAAATEAGGGRVGEPAYLCWEWNPDGVEVKGFHESAF